MNGEFERMISGLAGAAGAIAEGLMCAVVERIRSALRNEGECGAGEIAALQREIEVLREQVNR
jgi:hypothetical protein